MSEQTQQNGLGPWLTNSFGDRYLYEVNRNSLNRDGASALHDALYGDLFSKENCLILVIGTDSGTLLQDLAAQNIGAGTRIFCFELPTILDKLREDGAVPELHERIHCLVYDNFFALAAQYRFKEYFYIDTVQLTLSRAAQDGFLPEYQELFWKLQVDIYQFMWDLRGTLGSEDFIIRQLENLGENIRGARHLRGAFPGETAVLLAGGPSLDEALPWIKSHRDELVVLAVSRCARRLLDVGLSPDIIFSIDPHPISFDVSKEMLLLHEQSLFVHAYHVVPWLLGQWRGRSLYLGERFPWDSQYNEDSPPTPGPTVSNVALATAMEMGFTQIILAGLDLCHSRDGYTHALGSNEREAGPQLGRLSTQVETNAGWLAESTSDFATAIEGLAVQAETAGNLGIRLINPAPGAAKVSGVEHLPLQEIVVKRLKRPAVEVLTGLAPLPDPGERLAHLKTMKNELTAMYGHLVQVNRLASEALRCLDALFGRTGQPRHFRHKKQLDSIEKTINRRHTKAARLIKTCGIRDFLRLTRVDSETEWNEEEMERTGRAYYQAYRTSTRRLIDIISRCRDRIASRIQEDDVSPDLVKLAEQWRQDHQPGRVSLWRDRHPDAAARLNPEQHTLFSLLENEFQDILTQQDTSHMRRSKEFASLDSIRSKAQTLLRQGNHEGLDQLAQALKNHPAPEAGVLLLLVQGYQRELAGESALALRSYEQLLGSTDEKVLEDGVRRIASLCIDRQDLANAQLALEALTQISPAYMVQLAELCWLAGDRQQAVHTLLDYLESVPADLSAMIRLARYYEAMGMQDGARQLLRHVLELTPDNAMAKTLLEQQIRSAGG